jgi:hypothetical protein
MRSSEKKGVTSAGNVTNALVFEFIYDTWLGFFLGVGVTCYGKLFIGNEMVTYKNGGTPSVDFTCFRKSD